ncbi:hypothetical protein [Leucobacter sp. VD1]|uniref:hypothetical protein n=1 Tax=Leucobacter sp. VD1 TaxID=3080381 RepID=UPI003015B9D8
MHERVLRKPRYFTDADTLEAFINKIGIVSEGVWIENDTKGTPDFAKGVDDVAKLAPTIAKRPLVFRRTIAMRTRSGDGLTPEGQRIVDYQLRQRTDGQKASTVIRATSLDLLNSATSELMRHTEPMKYRDRRASRPLVEPYSIDEEATARQQHDLANAARRHGALWGAISGFGTAALTLVGGLIGL